MGNVCWCGQDDRPAERQGRPPRPRPQPLRTEPSPPAPAAHRPPSPIPAVPSPPESTGAGEPGPALSPTALQHPLAASFGQPLQRSPGGRWAAELDGPERRPPQQQQQQRVSPGNALAALQRLDSIGAELEKSLKDAALRAAAGPAATYADAERLPAELRVRSRARDPVRGMYRIEVDDGVPAWARLDRRFVLASEPALGQQQQLRFRAADSSCGVPAPHHVDHWERRVADDPPRWDAEGSLGFRVVVADGSAAASSCCSTPSATSLAAGRQLGASGRLSAGSPQESTHVPVQIEFADASGDRVKVQTMPGGAVGVTINGGPLLPPSRRLVCDSSSGVVYFADTGREVAIGDDSTRPHIFGRLRALSERAGAECSIVAGVARRP
eukprot:TRINITY_DN4980_c3_g1_i2.p1 TRINITY_DN4980_c3_g1~~TRINITY_DN4980_c3_g1_i2.p1  ORF type:complete len:411 (+),score=106.82 TRINITY_DN4980_c3_g1_i2:84-1235(+)